MNGRIFRQTAAPALSFILLVFLPVVFLGAGYVGMATDAQGEMPACPVMGVTAVCQMSSLAHMAKWQGLFSALLQREAAAFFVAALFCLSMLLWVRRLLGMERMFAVLWYAFGRKTASVRIPSPLQEAFSDGILNPRVF